MTQNVGEKSERARELLAAGRAGDPVALGELLNLYQDYLLAIAQQELPGGLKPKVGASDVVQETQIEAYQAEIKKLQGTEDKQRKEYEGFLNNLEVE